MTDQRTVELPPRRRIGDELLASVDPLWFWAQVDVRRPNECWPWTGDAHTNGYGRIPMEAHGPGASALTHRVAYVLGTGNPLGELNALHSCDNPPCCNYRMHLRAGTKADNTRDAIERGRLHRQVTDEQVSELRHRYSQGESSVALGAEFGISQVHALRLVTGAAQKYSPSPAQSPAWRVAGLRRSLTSLTEDQVVEIRCRYLRGGITQRVLAAEYGISQAYLSQIVTGKRCAVIIGPAIERKGGMDNGSRAATSGISSI